MSTFLIFKFFIWFHFFNRIINYLYFRSFYYFLSISCLLFFIRGGKLLSLYKICWFLNLNISIFGLFFYIFLNLLMYAHFGPGLFFRLLILHRYRLLRQKKRRRRIQLQWILLSESNINIFAMLSIDIPTFFHDTCACFYLFWIEFLKEFLLTKLFFSFVY